MDERRADPPSFRARGLSASLTATDLDASLRWYCDVVGFTVHEKHEREGELVAVSLVAGDVRLLLTRDDGARGWERSKGEGFSLYFTTVQDVDDLAALIEARGGALETPPTDMPWGPRLIRLRDPDGFKLAISSEG